MTERTTKSSGSVVALTGACGYLGAQLIRMLEEDPAVSKVVALDVRRPPVPLAKTRYHRLDLTLPTAASLLSDILERERVDTFVHLAFLYDITHRIEWAHELESVGTMHVLDACAKADVSHFVLWSSTLCYGARPSNPSRITEDAPLVDRDTSVYVADKVEAERQVEEFAMERPEKVVTRLRMAPLLAKGVQTLFGRYFSLPLVPVLAGHDPLMQFLDGTDAVAALKTALDRPVGGVFNIAAPGILPLKTILALLGRAWLPIVGPAAQLLSKTLWTMQFTRFPPEMTQYLRYSVVTDTSKAASQLGWTARHDLQSLLVRFGAPGGVTRGRGDMSGIEELIGRLS